MQHVFSISPHCRSVVAHTYQVRPAGASGNTFMRPDGRSTELVPSCHLALGLRSFLVLVLLVTSVASQSVPWRLR